MRALILVTFMCLVSPLLAQIEEGDVIDDLHSASTYYAVAALIRVGDAHPITFGGQLSLQAQLNYDNTALLELCLEYRQFDHAWIGSIAYIRYFEEAPLTVGPYLGGGLGFGAAGKQDSRSTLDLRATIGYALPLKGRTLLRFSIEYRRCLHNILGQVDAYDIILGGLSLAYEFY